MGNYYELTKSVRITTSDPIDGDRYIAQDMAGRQEIINTNRGHQGLQVYVIKATGNDTDGWNPALYALKDVTNNIWVEILTSDSDSIGVQNFIELSDTPSDWAAALDGSIVTVNDDGTTKTLTFTDAQNAFNKAFGIDSEMPGWVDPLVDPAHENSDPGSTDKVARIDHNHDAVYYDKVEVDTKIAAVNAGIKYIWDNQDEIKIDSPGGDGTGYTDGEQGLLKDSATAGDTGGNNTCNGDWTTEGDKAVYQYQYDSVTPANSCWKFLYSLGATGVSTADLVKLNSTPTGTITVTETHGGYTAGTVIPASDDVYKILKKILQKTVPPTYSGAQYTIKNTVVASGAVEVGTSLAGAFVENVHNQGIIKSYVTSSTTEDIPQIGALTSNKTLLQSTGGFAGSTVGSLIGKALKGSNVAEAKFVSTTETTPVKDSALAVYTGIPRYLEATNTSSITGQHVVAWGTTSSDTLLPTDRADMLDITNSNQLLGDTGTIYNQTFVPMPTGPTFIWVMLEGNYNSTQARAKVELHNRSTNENHFDKNDTKVTNPTVKDIGGDDVQYTVVYRDLNVVAENLPIDIIIH